MFSSNCGTVNYYYFYYSSTIVFDSVTRAQDRCASTLEPSKRTIPCCSRAVIPVSRNSGTRLAVRLRSRIIMLLLSARCTVARFVAKAEETYTHHAWNHFLVPFRGLSSLSYICVIQIMSYILQIVNQINFICKVLFCELNCMFFIYVYHRMCSVNSQMFSFQTSQTSRLVFGNDDLHFFRNS